MESSCRLCEHPMGDAVKVGDVARGGVPSPRYVCPECGLIQVCPQPSEDELAEYYQSGDYRDEYKAGASIILIEDGEFKRVNPGTLEYDDALMTMSRLQAVAMCQAVNVDGDTSILDVGCGEGRFLASIGAGVKVGLEMDHRAAEQSRERGLTVHECGIKDFAESYDGEGFDIVSAIHVLEHTHDPIGSLRDMATLCKPGGWVYLEVPSALDPSTPDMDECFQHVHLFDFTRHTLFATMQAAGLDRVGIAEPKWALRAWGQWSGGERRAYEDHGGMPASDVVATIEKFRRDHDKRMEAVESGRDPKLMKIAAEVKPMLNALRGVELVSAKYANEFLAKSNACLESMDPDPMVEEFRRGLALGRLEASRSHTQIVHLLRKAGGQ